MLHLDKLEIIGFKSFAEKTRVDFPGRITGIIGPNGCGKSNLSDAIGWVLGLQTARNLRGQKMDDVIFGGTNKRKRSGFAEVSLNLRRPEAEPLKINGMEISDPEIVIRRRLERSGESHYSINNRRCRLMDIHKLLEDGGLGFASYAIIAQGKIDSFLSSKPLDRRNLIEEAAQILGYKSKRKNAELKLEMAQQNLLRVNDILGEVERQLRSLKRQASKAARYKKLKEEFREIQKQRLAVEAANLKNLLTGVGEKLSGLRDSEIKVHADLEKNGKLFKEKNQEKDRIQNDLSELRQRLSELRLEIDRCENSIRHNEEQIRQYDETLGNSQKERQQLIQSLEKLSSESSGISIDLQGLEEKEGVVRETVQNRKLALEQASSKLRQEEIHLDDLRSRQIRLSAEEASLNNLKEQLTQRRKRASAETERVKSEREQAVLKLTELQVLGGKRRDLQASLEIKVRQLKDKALEQEQIRKKLEITLEDLRSAEKDLETRLVGLRERLQSLQELEVSRSHYSEGVQNVLNHLEKSKSVETTGTFADSIETSPEFEQLVEEFLSKELEYILVDSLDDALKGVPEIKALESGKCTFFGIHSTNGFGDRLSAGIEGISPDTSKGVFGRLGDILNMNPEVAAAFRRVLPDRAEAIVVSDIDHAMSLAHSYPQGTFITLQGEALTPQGLLSVTAQKSPKLGLLGLKRQKREIEKKIIAGKKELAKLVKSIQQNSLKFNQANSHLQELNQQLVEAEKDLIGARHAADENQREVQRQEQSVKVFDFELNRLATEEDELLQRKQTTESSLQSAVEDRQLVEAQLRKGRDQINLLREDLEKAQSELNEISSQMNILKERKFALRGTLERIAGQKKSLEQQIDSIADRQQSARNRIRDLKQAISDSKNGLENYHIEANRLQVDIEESKSTQEILLASLGKLEDVLEGLRNKREDHHRERSSLEIEQARYETQFQNLEKQCTESLQVPLHLAVSGIEIDSLDRELVRDRYEELRQRLESFGPINMTALAEYEENEQRHQFLSGQKTDIETSIEDTSRAIQEINRRTTRQFKEAFEVVNQNFKTVFQQLFGGGDCGMQLLDEDDVLECGIDVFAQPPGKRLQNVMLLSGGEKALTVFALLIGIFMYRPSSFCLLDEVDAPLDDANVKRFGELLSSMSEHTQFVLITHNKRTMEIADTLYGITMEEAGISKAVSVKF
jgi:chromosome segregation protein